MKKMRLEFDALEVDSFGTDAGEPVQRGTVRGHTGNPDCPAYATHEYPSCYVTDCGQFTCDWVRCYGTTGTGGGGNTMGGQYTCPNPDSCPY